ADELTATSLAEIPQDRLAGIVVRDGAANSHAAILTRAMGIPTVMGVDIRPEQLDKRQLIVDGYRGEVLIEPEPILIKEYQRLLKEEHALSKTAETAAELPGEL
ncbi:PEP-utilizing enzyme, partial [Rosenbergiella collisarenosi]